MMPMLEQKKNTTFSYGLGIAQIVAGIPIAIISMIMILVGFWGFRQAGGFYFIWQLILIPVTTGGAFLIYNGVKTYRFIDNYRKIAAAMEFKNRERVTALAQVTGQDLTSLVRDLRAMSQKGYFPNAYVDFDRCEFSLTDTQVPSPALGDGEIILKETARPSAMPLLSFPYAFLAYYIIKPFTSFSDLIIAGAIGAVICVIAYRKTPGVRVVAESKYKAQPALEPAPIDTGNDALDGLLSNAVTYAGDLNELSLSITNEKMIKPIKELLDVSRQIFAFVERQPAKIKQIRQFMNYYLPTTIKLLQSYRELSREPVKNESVTETMNKIENSMDEIVGTFQRELDNLYRDKAEDISVDIDVMLDMMRNQEISNDFDQDNI